MLYRNTNKRQDIMHFLANTKSHPTAQDIYDEQVKKYPNISLATIYRNLQTLIEQKKVVKLDIGDGLVHYDADTSNHAHLICDVCGKIEDINLPSTKEIVYNGFDIRRIDYQILGTCQKCQIKNKGE